MRSQVELDALLRAIDRRDAAEDTPLHVVPVLAVLGLALLVWAWARRTVRAEDRFVGAATEAPGRAA